MKETLQVINKMQADGVIDKYAIGGAIGATFYLEPTSTFDIDIFISFSDKPGIVSPAPIYDYLVRDRGYKAENEHILIEGWQVQFLPADDALNNEALLGSRETFFNGVKTWVMSPEHLMAIALKTGRPKDFIRLDQFLSGDPMVFDPFKFDEILNRHGLMGKLEAFQIRYAGVKA
jgi:hypothetical protein